MSSQDNPPNSPLLPCPLSFAQIGLLFPCLLVLVAISQNLSHPFNNYSKPELRGHFLLAGLQAHTDNAKLEKLTQIISLRITYNSLKSLRIYPGWKRPWISGNKTSKSWVCKMTQLAKELAANTEPTPATCQLTSMNVQWHTHMQINTCNFF